MFANSAAWTPENGSHVRKVETAKIWKWGDPDLRKRGDLLMQKSEKVCVPICKCAKIRTFVDPTF
jgi:hypothetical protein